MDVAPKRVAAHIIRKPTAQPVEAVCEVIENPGETSRVDVRELQKLMTKSSSVPVDLETDIEVVAEASQQMPVAKPSRLAHTVRRAESAPIIAPLAVEPAATVEMPAVVVAMDEPAETAPIVVAVPVMAMAPPRDRWTIVAVGALAVASVGLALAILM
ncbi:MAG: hypothetical protein QM831_18305 [Kofleriaceae bacterium]